VPRTLRFRPSRRTVRLALATVATGGSVLAVAAPAFATTPTSFTAGDLVVYQVTEASGGPSSTAGTVALVDYGTNGTPSGYSVAMPTANSGSTHEFVESGSATNDGLLTLSADGQFLYATGYQDAPGTTKLTKAASIPRVVGIVSSTGVVDTSTSLSDAQTEGTSAAPNNFRSATGLTGGTSAIYNAGDGGVATTSDGATSNTFLNTTNPNGTPHQVGTYNNNLYMSTSTNIVAVGTGLPPSASPTLTNLISSTPTGFDPNGFTFVTLGSGTAADTLYVADTGANAVEKYAFNGTSATLEGSVSVPNPTGIAVSVSSGVASLYVTAAATGTGNTFATVLDELTDSSGVAGTLPSGTTVNLLATAGASSSFHGLAWAPSAPAATTPESPIIVALPLLGLVLFGGAFVVYRRRHRTSAGPVSFS
jgi:hypothetical protein